MTIHTNGRRITTHEATVKTAAVEVKTLTISGKQVTLAVFRQLQHGALIDWPTLELLGTPWGHVNYHPDCLDDTYHERQDLRAFEHLHLVWQDGDELRQDVIPMVPQYESDDRRERAEFLAKWTVLYLTLKDLDQLFIAV